MEKEEGKFFESFLLFIVLKYFIEMLYEEMTNLVVVLLKKIIVDNNSLHLTLNLLLKNKF